MGMLFLFYLFPKFFAMISYLKGLVWRDEATVPPLSVGHTCVFLIVICILKQPLKKEAIKIISFFVIYLSRAWCSVI